ncbi:MAG: hypothetical protein HY863_04805 [Chloroflexi bacterium]|nr:hypothetical protein [Chloroflexota bacterium]
MENERFKSTTAVLVAVVTVLGAIVACMATSAASSAANADFEGLNAAIRAQKNEIINEIIAFEHYDAFTSYTRYLELGNLLYDPNADDETSRANGVIQREVWGVASGISSYFFQPRYVTADGVYDLERELNEAFTQDAQNEDLNSDPYFKESDRMHKRSSFLTADMIVLAVSFWFLQLAQVTEKNIKYLWVIVGILLGLAGVMGLMIGRLLI